MESGYQKLPEESMRTEWNEKKIEANSDYLHVEGHPVMEKWETPYMDRLAQIACRQAQSLFKHQGRIIVFGARDFSRSVFLADRFFRLKPIIKCDS